MVDSRLPRFYSRRDFLGLSGTAALATLSLGFRSTGLVRSESDNEDAPTLGRVATTRAHMYEQPSLGSKRTRTLWQDMVLPITGIAVGTGEPSYNHTWYHVNNAGYVHSGNIQPVQIEMNAPTPAIPKNGLLAEVTVPYTDALWDPDNINSTAYRLYYTSTHWIMGIRQDQLDETWYEVLEDFNQVRYFIKATHLRIISSDELTPISTEIPSGEKRLEVSLQHQTVVAYEGSTAVKTFNCSSGAKISYYYLTPTGNFSISTKRPSRHMVYRHWVYRYSYDLPGVPWVSYFNGDMAFHGTYWHNDFGRPYSNGCINLSPADAKWLYRWSIPQVPFEEQLIYGTTGTRVDINS